MSGKMSAQTNGGTTDSWQSAGQVLTKFDKNKDGALDFAEFKEMCLELFGPAECERHPDKVPEIFKALDLDSDGLLKGDEWIT